MKPAALGLAAILALLLLTACDTHKQERNLAQRELEAVAADLERARTALAEMDRAMARLEAEVKDARDNIRANSTEYEKNKLELAKYAMDHKLATIAAAAGAASLGAMLDDSLPSDEKSAMAVPAVIAVGYCLFNGSECVEVATRIGYYGTQINSFKNQMESHQKREAGIREQAATIEQQRTTVKTRADELSASAAGLRERIEALTCKFPVCF